MRRALRFIVIAAILLGIAWWISTIPGTLTAHAGAYIVQTSVPVAIVLLIAAVIIVVILLRVLGGIRRAPRGYGAWRGGRRSKLGEVATHRALNALAAGDAKAAQAESQRARKLLGETPLVLLLIAESARLAGDQPQSQAAFQKLAGEKNTAFLGHRGLLRLSAATGDHATASKHALSAADAYPGSAWLKNQRLDLAVRKTDWKAALTLARTPAETAALATAAAIAAPTNRETLAFAKQAIKASPGLAPASVTYATALRKAGKPRAAKRALLKAWTTAPNPLISAAYLEGISTPLERAQAAGDLAFVNPNHPESELLLAETALPAKLTGEAKRHANAAITGGLTDKRPYAVLAALDDGRDALAALANAPIPRWRCNSCFTEHDQWDPVCPHCAKPGTFTWTPAPSKALVPVSA
jgi:HemY protein